MKQKSAKLRKRIYQSRIYRASFVSKQSKNASAPIDIALDDDEIPAYMKYQSKPAKKAKARN